MSHATIAMSPAVQSLLALMPAVAVGTAVFGVSAGALLAAKKLRCDFEQAKSEFEMRCREDELAAQNVSQKAALRAMSASLFGAGIEAGNEHTTIAFLNRTLQDLAARARDAEQPEIAARAFELVEQVSEDSAKDILDAYFSLSDEFEANAIAAGKSAEGIRAAFAALRLEIQSSILIENEKLQTQLEAQLAKLETAGDDNVKVAQQGLANLKSRVRREISDQQDRIAREIQDRHDRQELVAETYAMHRALIQASDDTDEVSRAHSLLSALGAAFQQGAAPQISELEALLSKTRTLYKKCEARMDEVAAHAYVADSVKDVLLNMGYAVSEVPSEIATRDPGCMVSIDGDSGVVVSVDQNGRMLTEMVAFNQSGIDPDAEAEKKVCAVVDDILAGLKQRNIDMQEKNRKKLRPGHRLRVVKKAKTEEVAAASVPKARTVE